MLQGVYLIDKVRNVPAKTGNSNIYPSVESCRYYPPKPFTMANRTKKRQTPTVQAGSMADIAFLLLIFFLVTTTIVQDQGLLVQLPPYDDTTTPPKINERNLLKVRLNAQDQLLVEDMQISVNTLADHLQDFIVNPRERSRLAEHPRKAVVSLQCDRSTSYEAYLAVYDALKSGYRRIRDRAAQQQYGLAFGELSKPQQRMIARDWPILISEADPVDFKRE
jgi:biopolymer transport protein ExbD